MWAAAVVIPLAAMALPIALILLAVLADAVFLIWTAYRMWHDEWAVRVGDFISARLLHPIVRLVHPVHARPRFP
jgi:hypothetical protein